MADKKQNPEIFPSISSNETWKIVIKKDFFQMMMKVGNRGKKVIVILFYVMQ